MQKIKRKMFSAVFILLALFLVLPLNALALDEPHDTGHNTSRSRSRPPSTPTGDPGQASGGDPVIFSTGDYAYDLRDIYIPGRFPMEIRRGYHSQNRYDGPFGLGWNHNYNMRLIETHDISQLTGYSNFTLSSVTIRKGNGTRIKFDHYGGNNFVPPKGRFLTLSKTDGVYTMEGKDGIKYKFYDTGPLVYIEDRNGNKLTLSYDSSDRLSSVADDAGRSLTFTYGANSKIQTITDPAGRALNYRYDVHGNLVEFINPAGKSITYAYDLGHNLLSITDTVNNVYLANTYDDQERVVSQFFNGGTFTYSYDTDNKITTITDRKGIDTEYHMNDTGNPIKIVQDVGGLNLTNIKNYDSDLNIVSETDPDGSTTSYTYDQFGNILTVTNAQGSVTTFTYRPDFNLVTSITDPLGRVTTYQYDAKGNFIKGTNTLGEETTYTYDTNGDLSSIIDAAGSTTNFSRDTYGSLTNITGALGNQIDFTYDILGNMTSSTNPNGHTTQYAFNQLRQATQITAPLSNITKFTYDERGNKISTTDPLDNITTFVYNVNNLLSSMTNPSGKQSTLTHDANEKILTITDAESNTTTYTYDALGRLISLSDAMGQVTEYTYNGNGSLTSIKDSNGNTTTYTHDILNRLSQSTFPDGTTETYTYDAVGNQTSRTDRNGNTIVYSYDDLNRLISKTYPDNGQVTYTYDSLGRLLTATNADGTVSYQYDALGRTSQVDRNGKTITYEYDSMGNRTKLTYPDASYASYTYDALKRLTQIIDDTGQIITDFSYDNMGRIARQSRGNDTEAIFQWDQSSRLINLNNRISSTQALISSSTYTYDSVRNRTSKTTSQGTYSYSYDNIYRLAEVTYPNGSSSSYSFDAAGNWTTTIDSGTTSYTANNLNQYGSVGGATYTYDSNGNLISDGTNTYTYGYENRLIQATTPSDTITFTYGPEGKRISKTDSSGTTGYIYNFDQVITETDGAGNIVANYLYGNGMDAVLMMNRGGSRYYYHSDELGNIVRLTDSTGSTVETYQYNVYGGTSIFDGSGNQISGSGFGNPYMFIGRRYDGETGIYYLRARYYNPAIGRFITSDPLGYYGGINLYSYALNNPVNYSDPMGTNTTTDVGGLGAYLSGLGNGRFVENPLLKNAAAELAKLNGYRRMNPSPSLFPRLAQEVQRNIRGQQFTYQQAARNARLAKMTGAGLNVLGGVLAGAGEYMSCPTTTTGWGRATSVGGVTAINTAAGFNPYFAAGNAISGIVDMGAEGLGYQRPGAWEIMNNTGRFAGALVDGVAEGNTRGMERWISRMRSGSLGSVSQSLTNWGETAGEFWYDVFAGN